MVHSQTSSTDAPAEVPEASEWVYPGQHLWDEATALITEARPKFAFEGDADLIRRLAIALAQRSEMARESSFAVHLQAKRIRELHAALKELAHSCDPERFNFWSEMIDAQNEALAKARAALAAASGSSPSPANPSKTEGGE